MGTPIYTEDELQRLSHSDVTTLVRRLKSDEALQVLVQGTDVALSYIRQQFDLRPPSEDATV